jgi:hypothetical protein
LPRYLDAVADADGLAVPEFFTFGLAKAGIAVVLKMGHDNTKRSLQMFKNVE